MLQPGPIVDAVATFRFLIRKQNSVDMIRVMVSIVLI